MSGFVAVYAVATAAWLFVPDASLRAPALIVLTLALRLPFLAAEPRLSADVYRYMWDGRALSSGLNPYEQLPGDPRVNHPGIRTIYPPHAELLFAAVHDLTLWRLLLIAIDIGIVLMLRSTAYAACPVVIFEGVWSGHVDLVAGFLLLLAFRRRSGIAAALAVGMKLTPLAAIPAMFRWSSGAAGPAAPHSARLHRNRVIAFLATLLIPFAFFAMWGDVMPGLRDYAMRWIFNSPAYEVAFLTVDSLHIGALLKRLLPVPVVFQYAYSDFIARCALAVLAVGLIAWRRRSPVESVAALLLCAPAIHPWYWLVIAPLAIAQRSGVTWLIVCAPFSYLLYGGAPPLVVYLLCYALPAALIALPRISARASSGAGWLPAAMHPRTARDTSRW